MRISDAECQKSVIAGRESGSWAAGRDGLLGWTFETRLPCADCFKSQSEWAVGGGPWTDVRDGPLGWTLGWTFETDGPLGRTFETNDTASHRRLFQKSVRVGSGGRAVDGRPWRAAGMDFGMDFWNKRHGFLTPIISKVSQSGPWGPGRGGGPWTDVRDGPLGRTFETNGTAMAPVNVTTHHKCINGKVATYLDSQLISIDTN